VLGKLLVLFTLLLTIVTGGVYFVLWPLAQQYLTAVKSALVPAVESIRDTVPALPPEVGLDRMLTILPLLERIGLEGLAQIKLLAEGGITAEEAQQALGILRQQLSAEELNQLKSLLTSGQ
jgi:hypothetical protein